MCSVKLWLKQQLWSKGVRPSKWSILAAAACSIGLGMSNPAEAQVETPVAGRFPDEQSCFIDAIITNDYFSCQSDDYTYSSWQISYAPGLTCAGSTIAIAMNAWGERNQPPITAKKLAIPCGGKATVQYADFRNCPGALRALNDLGRVTASEIVVPANAKPQPEGVAIHSPSYFVRVPVRFGSSAVEGSADFRDQGDTAIAQWVVAMRSALEPCWSNEKPNVR